MSATDLPLIKVRYRSSFASGYSTDPIAPEFAVDRQGPGLLDHDGPVRFALRCPGCGEKRSFSPLARVMAEGTASRHRQYHCLLACTECGQVVYAQFVEWLPSAITPEYEFVTSAYGPRRYFGPGSCNVPDQLSALLWEAQRCYNGGANQACILVCWHIIRKGVRRQTRIQDYQEALKRDLMRHEKAVAERSNFADVIRLLTSDEPPMDRHSDLEAESCVVLVDALLNRLYPEESYD